jgi:protein involved in polysaccharide export with SLBB domain
LATVFHALYAAGGPNAQGSYREIKVIRKNEVVQTIDLYEFLVHGIQPSLRVQDNDIIHIPVYQQRITLLGEVKRAAVYELKNGETFQDLLAYAGGFGENAYMERVTIIRNSSREKQILDVTASDFGKFTLLNGDQIQIDGVLDRFENRVQIHGAVFRPGAYGLDNGLTLKGLIEKANGLKEDAFKSRGYIYRLNEDMSKSMIAFDVEQILKQAEADIPLKREDEVVIHSHFDLRETQRISIQGEVRAPGEFEFSSGMSIGELIQIAGGFKTGASPTRIEVSRRVRNSDALSSNGLTAKIFTIDVDPQLKISTSDFRLEPFDMVYVHSSEGYVEQRQVRIEGEVLYPGIYVINHKNERLSDLIARAGGLTSSAYIDGASLERIRYAASLQPSTVFDAQVERHLVGIDMGAILKKPGSQIDLLLEQGDVLRVPKLLQTVTVSGEVLNPNAIVYEPGKSLKNYINGAGGFTSKAYKKKVFVRYANGSAKSASQFLFFRSYPKVLPGSEIVVPVKPERQLFTAQNWVAISSTLASLTAIIVTIMR